MSVEGIDIITFGVEDVTQGLKFFTDFGLTVDTHATQLAQKSDRHILKTLNGAQIIIAPVNATDLPAAMEAGSTIREVVWGVTDAADLDHYRKVLADQPHFVDKNGRVGCTDPNGLAIAFQLSQKKEVIVECAVANTWNIRGRVDQPAPFYDKAEPIDIGHVVFFTDCHAALEKFYLEVVGFFASDRYPNRGTFMRCSAHGGHHDLFILEPPTGPKRGLNHLAFTVRDIHEVIGGGLAFSRKGWETQLGPGRHPVSSAYFWYFKNPCGALVEYYSDEDQLTEKWQAREFTPGPTVFAEWAIDGGIDGHTRRQHRLAKPVGKFLTDTSK